MLRDCALLLSNGDDPYDPNTFFIFDIIPVPEEVAAAVVLTGLSGGLTDSSGSAVSVGNFK